MKKLLIASLSLIALCSCSKSALQPEQKRFHQEFIVDYGHDTAIKSAASFCFEKDYVKKDTLWDFVTDNAIDENKFGLIEGTVQLLPGIQGFDLLTGQPNDSSGLGNRHMVRIKHFVKSYWL